MNHPAAEIVGIALRKIRKLANSRKYQSLLDESQALLDNLQQLIPPVAQKGSSPANPSSDLHEPPVAAVQEPQPEQDADIKGELPSAAGLPRPAEPGPTVAKQHFATEDLTEAVNSTQAIAAGGAERQSAAKEFPALPDLVPRTATALSDPVLTKIVNVMRLAIQTERPNIIEVALDCLQKLIAFRFMQGAVYALNVDKSSHDTEAAESLPASDPSTCTPQAQAIELMCRCDEIPDETVELHILKGLLTATTASSFTVHGQALLLAVRTCYNIYLMSRSEVNQTTAKASLTQMLNVVFQRLEADAIAVEVRPVVLSDVLGLPRNAGAGPQDAATVMAATVQSFLNNVIMVSGGMLGPTPQELRDSVAGAFQHDRQQPTQPAAGGPSSGVQPSPASLPGSLQPAVAEEQASSGSNPQAAAQAGAVTSEGHEPHLTPPAAPHPSCCTSPLTPHPTPPPHLTPAPAGGQCFPPSGGFGLGLQAGHGAQRSPEDQMRTMVLEKDAFLVFRALCKLSIRTSDTATAQDPTAVRGKVLALELIKVLLENSGLKFRRSDMYLNAIRQYLCVSLLKNSGSSVQAVLQLSCSIFLTLMSKFRTSLKAEPFETASAVSGPPSASAAAAQSAAAAASAQGVIPTAASLLYKSTLLRVLNEMCRDGQLLVDLFVNYDCDLDSLNLFERMVNGLVRTAQQPVASPPPSPLIVDPLNLYHQEMFLRHEALQSLVNLVEAMLHWYSSPSPAPAARPPTPAADAAAGAGTSGQQPPATAPAGNGTLGGGPSSSNLQDAGGDELGAKRAYKARFQEGIALFNKKPKKGIEWLQKEGMLGRSAEEVASFLAKTKDLDKTMIGDYMGERDDFHIRVMHAYVDNLDFVDVEFDTAIRLFLSGFRLPGEAQKIDRLMEKFAERYLKCNPTSFKSADVAYVLAYSVIMLNTDLHNPQVKKKMSKEAFLKNNRGINDKQDLPEDFMLALYDRIASNEIKMKDEGTELNLQPWSMSPNNIFNTLLSMLGAIKQTSRSEPSEESIKRTLDMLHEKARSATAVTVTESDAVRPMMEVGMTSLRDIFINSLCNFTHLHSPATMKYKNALAFKYLLQVASSVGDHLAERWVDVLRCISRWELLQQLASGMPTDAFLFSQPAAAHGIKAVLDKARKFMQEDSASDLSGGPGPTVVFTMTQFGSGSRAAAAAVAGIKDGQAVKSINSLAMNEASFKKLNIAGTGGFGKRSANDEFSNIPQDVINSCDSHELSAVFINSDKLNGEAVVAFVRALCCISADELANARSPRVFSLAKIVEIAHYNMTRIRLVWSRVWAVLSDYFIQVGCHPNLQVAMYAVDSLRQLAMKFLERDELANYTFQNDFLRPFVVVTRQSQAVEIRELILRCLSQMVLARVNNVKSGWKSMFMVFTTAAGDKEPQIVRLAFDTVEKIVREHFGHITETETTTFTDCVNCLIAFTNNPHSQDVALNSIAFLRFCALRLAEGAIGDLHGLPEGVAATTHHPMRVVALDGAPTPEGPGALGNGLPGSAHGVPGAQDLHVYFWFPLLAGLSELTFDPRQEIRASALEVLFDTLMHHGGSFAASFWKRVFYSVLLPIFDHVRAEVTDTTTFTSEKRRQQEDSWLYETCTRCLQHLVDVFVQFYEETKQLLPQLLDLLLGFMNRSHQSLAAVGVAAFVRLVNSAATRMDSNAWATVTNFLMTSTQEICPSAYDLVTPPQRSPAAASAAAATAAAAAAGVAGGLGAQSMAHLVLTPPSAPAPAQPARAQPPAQQGEAAVQQQSSQGGAAAAAASLGHSDSSQGQQGQGQASRAATSVSSQQPSQQARQGVGVQLPAATPPSHIQGFTVLSQATTANAAASGAARRGAAAADTLGSAYSLREGAGARRLAKFKSQAGVQLLLVQGCSDIYSKQYSCMPPAALCKVLQTLELIASHARGIDMDLDLRKRLAMQQAEDRVAEDRIVADPPLLRLEMEASHAYLSVLLHLMTLANTRDGARLHAASNPGPCMVQLCMAILSRFALGSAGNGVRPDAAYMAEAATRLQQLQASQQAAAEKAAVDAVASAGLSTVFAGVSGRTAAQQRAMAAKMSAVACAAQGKTPDQKSLIVGRTSAGVPVLMATPAVEYAPFAPLVGSALKALGGLDDASFKGHLPQFFPLMTSLIQTDYAPPEVLRVLSDLFAKRVGPIIGVMNATAAMEAAAGGGTGPVGH
ncbi:hypothetical protein V8C86DRAFT_3013062 [Haematococcus lacustris]